MLLNNDFVKNVADTQRSKFSKAWPSKNQGSSHIVQINSDRYCSSGIVNAGFTEGTQVQTTEMEIDNNCENDSFDQIA
eukprot:Pgem_evm1s18723